MVGVLVTLVLLVVASQTIGVLAIQGIPTPTPPSVVSGCHDRFTNCSSYSLSACRTHRGWALMNCPSTCRLCHFVESIPPVSRTCFDVLPNCFMYWDDCGDPRFGPWLRENCNRTCRLCGGAPNPTPTEPVSTCNDRFTNCTSYSLITCTQHEGWALTNCAATCNLCSVLGGLPPVTSTCFDAQPDCLMQWTNCPDPRYRTWLLENCKRTCSLCEDVVTTATATCPQGYTGPGCTQFIKCTPNPCQNGGECYPDGLNFRCSCANTAFSGTLCTAPPTFAPPPGK